MKIVSITSVLFQLTEAARFIAPCALKPRNATEEVYTALPRFSAEELPSSWDWRDINGENMVTTDRSYSNPRACSGCWAFAAVHALSDRIKIQRKAAFPEVNLSPQPLLTCGYEIGNGCRGGGVIDAMRYIKEKGITDETCSPFTGKGHDTGDVCLGSTLCSTCSANGACEIPKKYDTFHVEEFGTVSGEQAIRSEIKARGPVVCHMHVDEAFRSNYRADSVWDFSDTDNAAEPNHAAEVAGWGVDADGSQFWIARFAFGSNWGDHGWAKLRRSANGHVEKAGCVWATVNSDAWKDWTLYPSVKYTAPMTPAVSKSIGDVVPESGYLTLRGSDGKMHEYAINELPKGNKPRRGHAMGGDKAATPEAPLAQHCEQATVDSPDPQFLVERPFIVDNSERKYDKPSNRAGGYKATPKPTNICSTYSMVCSQDPTCQCETGYYKVLDSRAIDNSTCYLCVPKVAGVQVSNEANEDLPKSWDWRDVNGNNYLSFTRNQHNPSYCGGCWAFASTSAFADRLTIKSDRRWPNKAISPQQVINCRGGGDCYGGDKYGVYDFFYTYGAVHDTCRGYTATNFDDFLGWCPAEARCMECTDGPEGCKATANYRTWRIKDFARLETADQIKREIWKRGPVGCGVDATQQMDDYEGGVFYQDKADAEINHEVSLVGWGLDPESKDEYWIMRNSWGSFWGEHGYMRIKFGTLLIDTACSWGEPEDKFDGEVIPNVPLQVGNTDSLVVANYVEMDPTGNAVDLHPASESAEDTVEITV
ncbi:hypothetical protein FOL47_004776 [Perkinsus chesapeaki]|uniref:Peptidase C1A papain C-terminal domain-containing protein n=1 Tax=Perkinsus chesapeaki TaxID=330153 RepID=A0A7J6MYY4_PERCH|nr:hypothetical protein FOL47_004776 [Perkinsus chesapeaki]